ncbi:XF1762 family protein [Catenulispora rubra]|uniref:XF1762 family protein n=1 Tax=Catenulispora rubra TaxID=280293 RepID=UPI001E5DE7EF|nr:XF1762 family protein [Catenulispora rubra]
MSFAEACAFIDTHHRHHQRPRGHKCSIGLTDPTGALVAVAIVGRPVARHLDDGLTLEVTRLATLGVPNSCSRLYSAAWKAGRAIGYHRMITYTQDGEHGASLRASGWHKVRDLRARPGWSSATRPRPDRGTDNIARTLWQTDSTTAQP